MIIKSLSVLLTCSSQHFWCPSHCVWKLIGWPFQSIILKSEAIKFPMQHESIILMMMLVTGPYGHSAVRDLPGNLSIYALAKHLWDVTDWQRKESSLYQRRWYKWERNYLGNANQVICINIASCQSILIKNGDERVWFVCSYSEKFSIFSNHIINLNRVIQAKSASQRSEYANVNFCAHLFIYTKHLKSQVEPWDFLFVHVINYSYPPDLTL